MRETETHTVFQIYLSILIHLVRGSSLPFQPDRDLVIKYALSNQEGEKMRTRGFLCSIVHFSPVRTFPYLGLEKISKQKKKKDHWRERDLRKLSRSIRERKAVQL